MGANFSIRLQEVLAHTVSDASFGILPSRMDTDLTRKTKALVTAAGLADAGLYNATLELRVTQPLLRVDGVDPPDVQDRRMPAFRFTLRRTVGFCYGPPDSIA
jgi:hypothetical protein